MGHKSTRITEQLYARIKDEDLADRALDALDPRYARRSHRARGTRPPMNTITELPDPKRNLVFHEVQGERDSLTEWSKRTGIPKTTLHYRVVTVGMTMPQAIALGAGRRGKPLLAEKGAASASSNKVDAKSPFETLPPRTRGKRDRRPTTLEDCRECAADPMEKLDSVDVMDAPTPTPELKKPRKKRGFMVPRDGIEPPTRGFSSTWRVWPTPRKDKGKVERTRSGWSHVGLGWGKLS